MPLALYEFRYVIKIKKLPDIIIDKQEFILWEAIDDGENGAEDSHSAVGCTL